MVAKCVVPCRPLSSLSMNRPKSSQKCRTWFVMCIGDMGSHQRLFSSGKHMLSDSCSAMTAESASKTVVAKEWLKKGLRVGINYLDDLRILT